MACLLSVNGNLRSLYKQAGVEEERSIGYKALDIGEPLVVRYLYFFIKYEPNERENQLMISTFVKTMEEKQGAAEAINYYNPKTIFENGQFRLTDFGAQYYGHELCYYTKSYLGESLRLTTKIMELDKVNKNLVKAIKGGISTIAGMPAFVEFLPYFALVSTGVSIFVKMADIFNRDDVIEPGYNLDLHFNRPNARRLQGGRIVCIPRKDEADFLNEYKLSRNNRLVDASNGEEYTESAYYVLQVSNEKNSLYENFDYFQYAAELLAKTNRDNPREVVDSIVSLTKGYSDIAAMRQIEELALDIDSPDSRKKVKGLYKSMTPDAQRLYQSRIEEMLASKED